MSYRTLKRTLGETSLERKCRLLFGTCLLVLISASFWGYSAQSDYHVFNMIAEEMSYTVLIEKHFTAQESEKNLRLADEKIAGMVRRREFHADILYPKNEKNYGEPTDELEWKLMDEWLEIGEHLKSDEDVRELKTQSYRRRRTKTLPTAVANSESAGGERSMVVYDYYTPVFVKEGCILCHKAIGPVPYDNLKVGDLFAVVHLEIPAAEMTKEQRESWAILAATGIATVTLAMGAFYVIVRYVIVKPLRHLRDVSNAVRAGDVEQRAVIHTGDEFEELGASFNRMLRQLLRQQDELREVNVELDGKLDELAQANMQLFEMNQLKSDFLATVSHELRTPLNSILGFSDLLNDSELAPEKRQRYANNIQRSGRQLLEMINDILDLAKIESGKLETRPSEFDVGLVVATQCDMARPLSNKKNIDLEFQFPPNLPPIYQDQGKLEQILNNLLSNAIKFTPDGGRIKVQVLRGAQGDLRLTVEDTGVGISPSEQQLVFEKFRQGTTVLPGGTAMTREYSGTGLGLSIVRELCRLLGGDITLESELGRGSEFTVHLPWHLSESPKLESALADQLNQLTKPRHEMPTRG